ncbi:MAG: YlbF family regulator [Clostridia bacterium]|nr:YlbF family regulator [Clostridia bacterium]
MEIYAKAQELANLIAESKELKAMRDAEAAMMCDPEARKLVEVYQDLQMEAMKSGLQFDQLPEEMRKEIELTEEKMSQNAKIVAYMEAQDAFEHILKSVNLIISNALNGNQNTCSSSGCAGCTGC